MYILDNKLFILAFLLSAISCTNFSSKSNVSNDYEFDRLKVFSGQYLSSELDIKLYLYHNLIFANQRRYSQPQTYALVSEQDFGIIQKVFSDDDIIFTISQETAVPRYNPAFPWPENMQLSDIFEGNVILCKFTFSYMGNGELKVMVETNREGRYRTIGYFFKKDQEYWRESGIELHTFN